MAVLVLHSGLKDSREADYTATDRPVRLSRFDLMVMALCLSVKLLYVKSGQYRDG